MSLTGSLADTTLVNDPNTGALVEYGSLSATDQKSVQQALNDPNFFAGPTIQDTSAGGFVATPTDSATQSTTQVVNGPYTSSEAPNYAVSGGWSPDQIGSVGGGYDPNNPSYGNESNSIGGDVAVSNNFNGAPNFDPNATGPGGYVPGTEDYYTGGGYDPSQAGLSDPTNSRLENAGLLPGGATSTPATQPSVAFQSVNGPAGTASSTDNDWRVRISLADNATIFYKAPSATGENQLMKPLKTTNGVVFPYTPTINITHAANYVSQNPTHSNYAQQFYNNSEVSDIQITGDFTVQSVSEGQYLMACVYFFRSCTKMFFGSGANVGNPPPIVFLDGYGSHYFPHVPCVISGFTHTLGSDVDYIEVPITSTTLQNVNIQADNVNIGHVQLTQQEQQYVPSLLQSSTTQTAATQQATKTQFQTVTTTTRVPTNSTIVITLKPVYSRKNLHDRFDLNKFAAGGLLQDKINGYGGFI